MKILATVNLSKGFAPWVQMTKDLTPEMQKAGVKIVWAGTNPEENKVFNSYRNAKCRTNEDFWRKRGCS